MDALGLAAALDTALLDDEELLAGAGMWAGFADPFPRWTTHVHTDD